MSKRNQWAGKEWIYIQPNDSDVPYIFRFTVCSTQTANDGHLPFGTTISSVVVSASNADGEDATADLIHGTPSVSDNDVQVNLDYPDAGEYRITIICTLSSGAKIQTDFTRIRCGNY